MTNLLALNRQSYRDHCLIVIGPGTLAEEVLAKRRLNAGGRLLHVLTDQNDQKLWRACCGQSLSGLGGLLFLAAPQEEIHCICPAFAPCLPHTLVEHRPGFLRIKTEGNLGDSHDRWTDASHPSFRCKRLYWGRNVRGNCTETGYAAGSGLWCPGDESRLEILWGRFLCVGWFLSILLLLLWHTVRQVVSIHFELHAETGDFPWWRALLTGINSAVFCGVGLGECVSLSFAGLPPTYLSHCVGIFAGTLVCSGLSALHAADVVFINRGWTGSWCCGLRHFVCSKWTHISWTPLALMFSLCFGKHHRNSWPWITCIRHNLDIYFPAWQRSEQRCHFILTHCNCPVWNSMCLLCENHLLSTCGCKAACSPWWHRPCEYALDVDCSPRLCRISTDGWHVFKCRSETVSSPGWVLHAWPSCWTFFLAWDGCDGWPFSSWKDLLGFV